MATGNRRMTYSRSLLVLCSRRHGGELERRAEAAPLLRPGYAETQPDPLHGRGNRFRGFPDGCSHPEDHPRGIRRMHSHQHRAPYTDRHGQRQGSGVG
jgi:hypothetical protein